jgi:SWI/SNF-related matrix-associated actin-dependent regulator of chromatin subfamily A member 5
MSTALALVQRKLTSVCRLLVNDDIDAIIARGEERTSALNSKYEGLNFEDLSNFKSEASVQQWEGEDFRAGVLHLFFVTS